MVRRVNLSVSDLNTKEPAPPYVAYKTELGEMIVGDSASAFATGVGRKYKGKVQIIFTSPPVPLNRKKAYGNMRGRSTWSGSAASPTSSENC